LPVKSARFLKEDQRRTGTEFATSGLDKPLVEVNIMAKSKKQPAKAPPVAVAAPPAPTAAPAVRAGIAGIQPSLDGQATAVQPSAKVMPEDQVRLRAYLKWEAVGKPPGDGVGFWLEAERELLPKAAAATQPRRV
jgi:hypothetical protein